MKRGEVWWADLSPPTGQRPVVLLSRDDAYVIRALVTVAPVTTRIRRIPAEVSLGPEDGLPRTCVANLDAIVTMAKSSLRERITALVPEKHQTLDAALHFALGLED